MKFRMSLSCTPWLTIFTDYDSVVYRDRYERAQFVAAPIA